MDAAFDHSRRLSGTNLYFDDDGAALEAGPEAATDAILQRWREGIALARRALRWPDGPIIVRHHATGVSLAFAAPIDQLYVATEVNEWALLRALGLPCAIGDHDSSLVVDGDAASLAALRERAKAEAQPALRALLDEAQSRGVPAHADDDVLSIGEGMHAQAWPIDALPEPADVAWPRLRRVPKAAVTGSNGKTTTTRLLAALLEAHGWRTGYSSTDGIVVAGECVEAGDFSGPMGLRAVLRHADVEAGVLETARGGLLRRGVAVRDADVALVTNVSADHFGEYGIHDLDALAEVKLLVAKTLASEGTLIANAGDAVLAARAAALQPPRRVAWFARELRDARARGLPACGVRNERLRIIDGERDIDLGAIDAMPLTLGGVVGYNIENIAAASLAAYLMGVSADVIRAGLARFGLDPSQNRGRLQRWQAHGVDVLLDYAHNPEGLQGLLQVAGALRGHGRLALLLGQAGNRSDEDLRALANVAATARPDRVWLKDIGGEYMRGREPGEVAGILRQALLDAGMREDALPVCLDEHQAARAALAWARPGDMLVLPVHEAEQRDSVISMIEDWQAHSNERGTGMPGNR